MCKSTALLYEPDRVSEIKFHLRHGETLEVFFQALEAVTAQEGYVKSTV